MVIMETNKQNKINNIKQIKFLTTMKQNLFNKLWLRVGMIVAIMTTALSGTVWAEDVTDELTASLFSATNTTYANFSGVSVTDGSSAVYAGNSAKTSSGGIQLRSKNSNSGIVSTTSGGDRIKSVSVTYESGTNTLDVYGSNTAYTAASDLYNSSSQGTKIGSLSATGSVTVTGDYKYIGLRSNNGALYLTDITIVWETSGSTQTVAAPTFSPAAGTYTSALSVTLAQEDAAIILYTTDGTDPSFENSNGEEYTAPISVTSTTTIKAIAVDDDGNESSVATATYTIVTLEHAGTAADPYSVADARALLTAAPSSTFENVYVSGIISQVDSYNSTHHSITYWISDDGTTTDQFEVYGGLGLNGEGFSSKDDLIVGSSVTVKGNIKKYNSTFEFDLNSQIVSLVEPTYPIINAEATLSLAYNATSGEIAYTITNPTSAALTATSSASWISNITVDASSVTFTTTANGGTADREATIILSYTGAESVTVTVTQGHFVADYAELPFEFDGGQADIAETAGLTESGLGSDYKNSPYLKLDGTGDYVLLKINERPGVLTFDIKGNGAGSDPWAGTFKVQTSTDGTTYTDLKTYDALTSTTQSESFSNLGADVCYIKWIYAEKTSGNVALGNITLSAYVAPQTYTLTIPVTENVNISAAYGTDGIMNEGDAEEIEQGTTITLTVDVAEGYVLQSLTVSGGESQSFTPSPVSGSEGAYTFTMPAYNATVNVTVVEYVAPVGASYVLATSITSGKTYVIANADGTKVMGKTQNNNNRAAVDASLDGTILTADEACEFTIEGNENDGYTIYDANYPGYLYAASGSSNHLKTEAELDANNTGVWAITIDATTGEASVIAQGTNTRNDMRYNPNNGSPIFSCYASTSELAGVRFFEKVEATPADDVEVTIAIGYSTLYYGDRNLVVPADVEAYTYKVTTKLEVSKTYEEGDVIPAGTAVVLKAANGSYTFEATTETGEGDEDNALKGSDVEATTTGGTYYYALSLNSSSDLSSVGFYWMATDGAAFTCGAHKAYLALDNTFAELASGGVKGFIALPDDDATAISSVESFTEDGAIYNLAGQRLQKMQKGINIVNGKKILK